jgi:hypothetical protein
MLSLTILSFGIYSSTVARSRRFLLHGAQNEIIKRFEVAVMDGQCLPFAEVKRQPRVIPA